ncbi:MAG: acyltransferase [Desulfobacterota bacterium]|nr:acyltransferase [Thermodesulfobacteriota bacterium]
MTDPWFQNFEVAKLAAASPDLVNSVLLMLILLAALFSTKKNIADNHAPLSTTQTEQVRGIAILLVILGHLLFHVLKPRAALILSGEAVACFFLLSGFGLTMSIRNTRKIPDTFWGRRYRRVMIPYWCATVLVLAADHVILGKTYPVFMIALTTLGINITEAATHLDYVRWYITLQLIWYLLFFCCFSIFRRSYAVRLLFICGVCIIVLDYYLARQGWSQIFAFPFGCMCAISYDRVCAVYTQHRPTLTTAAWSALIWLFIYKTKLNPLLEATAPQFICKLVAETNGLILAVSICIIIARFWDAGYHSRFLLLCGRVSYALFLLHGPLLIKYNPLIRSAETLPLIMQCSLFFCMMLLIAWGFQRIVLLIQAGVSTDKKSQQTSIQRI